MDSKSRRPPWILGAVGAAWLAWISWTLTWLSASTDWSMSSAWSGVVLSWLSLIVTVSCIWILVHQGRSVERLGPILILCHGILSTIFIFVAVDRGWIVTLLALAPHLPLALALSVRCHEQRVLRRLLSVTCAATVLPALLLLLWSLANPLVIAAASIIRAEGAPFCLQHTAQNLGYVEVASWRELSGFKLQAPWSNGGGSDEFQFTFHAVLVVETSSGATFHNWSYYRQSFQPMAERARQALHIRQVCIPRKNFFADLPL